MTWLDKFIACRETESNLQRTDVDADVEEPGVGNDNEYTEVEENEGDANNNASVISLNSNRSLVTGRSQYQKRK